MSNRSEWKASQAYRDARAALKAKLRGTSYRWTERAASAHGDHIMEINSSNEYFCHTCSVAGIH